MVSTPDFQPLYKQVYNVLVSRIADGDWRPAKALPSEQALASELGVSQGTVRRAMDALAAENLILRHQGRGSFVAEHTQEHALFRFFRLSRPAPNHARVTPTLGSERTVRRLANNKERWKLALRGKAEVVEIRRTRLIDESPRVVEKIILPHRLFHGIEKEKHLPNTLYSLYQEGFGISIAVAKEELRAVLANKKDAAALRISAGTPLLQIDRIAVALDGQPVEWRISRCDTKDIVYAIEVK